MPKDSESHNIEEEQAANRSYLIENLPENLTDYVEKTDCFVPIINEEDLKFYEAEDYSERIPGALETGQPIIIKGPYGFYPNPENIPKRTYLTPQEVVAESKSKFMIRKIAQSFGAKEKFYMDYAVQLEEEGSVAMFRFLSTTDALKRHPDASLEEFLGILQDRDSINRIDRFGEYLETITIIKSKSD